MHSRRAAILLAPVSLIIGQERKELDKGPPLESALVKEFVGAAHGKLDKTREMLGAQPALLNATWDWGGGDFETGLGGASHMGNREIAEFLIGKGARADIFAAAMLGQIDIVKAFVKAFPGIERSLGPHKIPLLVHAKKGGTQSLAVVEYLQSLG
ncbi:MAG: ankyrin repeat domain-containing protein [Bryobacteraceae bacterium]